jgi:hypothetical protein
VPNIFSNSPSVDVEMLWKEVRQNKDSEEQAKKRENTEEHLLKEVQVKMMLATGLEKDQEDKNEDAHTEREDEVFLMVVQIERKRVI